MILNILIQILCNVFIQNDDHIMSLLKTEIMIFDIILFLNICEIIKEENYEWIVHFFNLKYKKLIVCNKL